MRTFDLSRRIASRHIATPDEYRAALAELDRLTDRISFSTPQQVVAHILEARGLTRADLTSHMGGRSRVSDFFAGHRRLSTNQVLALRDLLNVSADVLLPRFGAAEQRARTVAERSPGYGSAEPSAQEPGAGEQRQARTRGGVAKRSPTKAIGVVSSKRTKKR